MVKNYYHILGVSEQATADEIKKAFRVKALKSHPDVNPSLTARSEFVEVNEAYAVLSDQDKRLVYNDRLARSRRPKGTQTAAKGTSTGKDRDPKRRTEASQQAYEQYVKQAQQRARQQASMGYEQYKRTRIDDFEVDMFSIAQLSMFICAILLALFLMAAPFFIAIYLNWKFLLVCLFTIPLGFHMIRNFSQQYMQFRIQARKSRPRNR